MEPEVMMVSKRNLLFQGSILRFHVNFQFRGFESSILQVNVTCYHVFLDGRKCHQRKIMIRYHEVDRWNINLPQKKIRQPLTFPTLHLTLFKKKNMKQKSSRKKNVVPLRSKAANFTPPSKELIRMAKEGSLCRIESSSSTGWIIGCTPDPNGGPLREIP